MVALERGSEVRKRGRHPYFTVRGALGWTVLVGLGVLVAFQAVPVPGEDNNTLDGRSHSVGGRFVVERAVRGVGGKSRSDDWVHNG